MISKLKGVDFAPNIPNTQYTFDKNNESEQPDSPTLSNMPPN